MTELSDELIELGKRWVAAGCYWRYGMAAIRAEGNNWVPLLVGDKTEWEGIHWCLDNHHRLRQVDLRVRTIPDLRVKSSSAFLLEETRSAWEPYRGEEPIDSTIYLDGKWGYGRFSDENTVNYIVRPAFDTEVEALIAAREGVPGALHGKPYHRR